jgi:hypothetical protein
MAHELGHVLLAHGSHRPAIGGCGADFAIPVYQFSRSTSPT